MSIPYIMFIDGIEIETEHFIDNPLKYDIEKILIKFPNIINKINKTVIKDEIYFKLIKNKDLDISNLPDHLKTPELCDHIIKTSKYIFSSKIPEDCEKYITFDMCRSALLSDLWNIKHIPKQFITKEMSDIAFSRSFNAFQYIPDEFKTFEMCVEITVKNYTLLFEFVPNHFKTKELYNYVYQNQLLLSYIPKKFHDKELYDKAIKHDEFLNKKNNIYHIFNPQYLIDNKLVQVKQKVFDGCLICHVIKKYYFVYLCGHEVCIDCHEKRCYYKCNDIDITTLYENIF